MPTSVEQSCAECGYPLVGLPDVGRCPECGTGYDKHTLKNVDDPSRSQKRLARRLRRLRTVLIAVAGLAVMASCSCLGILADSYRPAAVGLVIMGIFLLGAATSFVYEREEES